MKLLSNINCLPKIALAAALLCAVPAQSQLTTGRLEEKFNQFRVNNLQEKLYMHVDRNFYVAGDILWCKVYVVDATLHQPLDLSKVAYVEVLDENNTAVMQAKLELAKGKGNGSLAIPSSIKSGNYKIRAYTSWMKNTGPDYFFEKVITVVNAQKSREIITTVAQKTTAPEIYIFPEGGNLVEGIASTVACKVMGSNGKGAGYKGNIVDENNRSVASFQSLLFGMCHFNFTPGAGHRYKAVIETVSGSFTKDLPQVFGKGYVMSLTRDNRVNVSVQSNVDEGRNVFLLVHARQSLKTVMQSVIVNGRAVFSLDPSKIGEGVTHFTVFNSEGKPLCERLYFSYPAQKLSIGVNGNLPSYGTRSKIDFDLRPVAKNSATQQTDMSVSVYRVDELQAVEEQDIQSFLWLNADLKGHIESPSFYFGGSPMAKDAMENLMLTQGWRRFKWDDVLSGQPPVLAFAPEHSGHIITGKVLSATTGKPVANIESYLSAPGRNSNFRVSVSDAMGRIKYDVQNMKGSSEVIVQTDPLVDTTSRIEINNPFFEQYASTTVPPFYLSVAKENLLRDQSVGVQVQGMYAGNKLKTFFPNADTSGLLFNPNAQYMLDDYTRFTTMEEVLREYVGLMDVQKRGDRFKLLMLEDYDIPMADMRMTQFYQANPLILVDGVPIFNISKLIAFDPLKLRKLEANNKRYFMGESSYPGILNFTTYKGDFAGFELEPHAIVLDYEGLQLEREFYSPVHDGSEADTRLPDFRTLLYWSHDVAVDAKGERHVRFYTSDKTGDYVVIVQGLSAGGESGSAMFKFEVK
jgi:hypothetical protein